MVKGVVLILGVVCLTFCGCKKDQLSTEIEKVVKEWTGKKLYFRKMFFVNRLIGILCVFLPVQHLIKY